MGGINRKVVNQTADANYPYVTSITCQPRVHACRTDIYAWGCMPRAGRVRDRMRIRIKKLVLCNPHGGPQRWISVRFIICAAALTRGCSRARAHPREHWGRVEVAYKDNKSSVPLCLIRTSGLDFG